MYVTRRIVTSYIIQTERSVDQLKRKPSREIRSLSWQQAEKYETQPQEPGPITAGITVPQCHRKGGKPKIGDHIHIFSDGSHTICDLYDETRRPVQCNARRGVGVRGQEL